jgi:hypothetical protein
MLKILHFSVYKYIPIGVLNQLKGEYQTARQINHSFSWTIKVFSHDTTEVPFLDRVFVTGRVRLVKNIINYIVLRTKAYGWLRKNAGFFDMSLIRYRSGDIFQFLYHYSFCNYYTIHHTFEIQEAKTRGKIAGLIESSIEKLLGTKVIEKSTGIIGVTPEIVEYELSRISKRKPSYCHPNGVDLDKYTILPDHRSGIYKFLFVMSHDAPWQGLDILIEHMLMTTEEFELHIVGNVEQKKYSRDLRIVFHGSRDSEYVSELVAKCDLGLSSFGLHRKGMTQACPLKVREYLAQGLPVYGGHIDSGLPDSFPYYKIGNPQPSAILEFAATCRKQNRIDVRNSATPYIDKKILMRNLIDWLDNN